MGTLAQAKTYGGIGSVLLLVGPFVPLAGIVVSIIGFVLALVAVKYISDTVGDRAIYSNMLYFVIFAIIGSVVAFLFVFAAFLPFAGTGIPTGGFDLTDPATILAATTVLIGLGIAWVVTIIAALFLRRSFEGISNRLGVGLFGTAGLLYFIGAILVIVIVGFLLILIAVILMIVAFFSIPDQPPAPMVAQPPPAS